VYNSKSEKYKTLNDKELQKSLKNETKI
jgi:hypothetical protein